MNVDDVANDDDGDHEKNGDDYCLVLNVSDHDCHNCYLSDPGHENGRQIYQPNSPTNQAQILPTRNGKRKEHILSNYAAYLQLKGNKKIFAGFSP